MSNSSVLHSYYQVGGKSVVETSVALDVSLNASLSGPSVALDHIVEGEGSGPSLVRVAQSHPVPAFRYNNPDDLKLSLFYLSGEARKIDYVRSRIKKGRERPMTKANSGRTTIPWGREGMLEFITKRFTIEELAFNGLRYQYNRRDRAGWPLGAVRMTLDATSEINQSFFEAQKLCVSALRAISTRVDIETADSIQIGTINTQNTSREQIFQAVEHASLELQAEPIAVEVGRLILKHKEG